MAPGRVGRSPALALALLVAGLAGCLPRWRAAPPVPPRPAHVAALLAGLEARREALGALRARIRARYEGPGGRQAVRAAVAARRPASLRLDFLSPFGVALAAATTDGGSLWVMAPGQGVRYEGRADPKSLGRLLHIRLAPADAVEILLGQPPLRVAAGDGELGYEPGGGGGGAGRFRVRLPLGDGGLEALWFDGASHLPVGVTELDSEGRVVLRAEFAEYAPAPRNPAAALVFPRRVVVETPPEGVRLEISYEHVELNPHLPTRLFAPPPAARVAGLEELE